MKWVLTWVLLLLHLVTDAQWPSCPDFGKSNWESVGAFDAAQDTVKRVAKWLCDTPLSWEFEKRTKANAYVLQWMVNHPTKRWETEFKCLGPVEEEMDLMYAYLQAQLYYSLSHEKVQVVLQDQFIMQTLSKKILQSEKYAHRKEWKKMTRAYRRHREKKFLADCYKK
jgi:hypothetical protein